MQQRMALIAFLLIGIAACSTSGNSSTSNNPLSGVTILTATPTPTPSPRQTATPTPAPTATPTPSPTPSPTPIGATAAPVTPSPTPSPTPMPTVNPNVLVDGGFESEGAADMTFSSWSKCSFIHPGTGATSSPYPAVASGLVTGDIVSASDPSFLVGPTPAATPFATVSSQPNSGTYAALTYSGTYANTTAFPPGAAQASAKAGANGICQTFVVPTDAMLTFFVNEGSSDTDTATGTYFDQEGDIFAGASTTGTPVSVFLDKDTQNPKATTTYVSGYQMKGPYALTASPFNFTPGQTVTLFLGTFESSSSNFYGAYAFFDDVAVSGTPLATTSVERRTPSFGRR